MITTETEASTAEAPAATGQGRPSGENIPAPRDGSVFDLIGSLIDDSRRILRKEAQLAKEEVGSSLKKGVRGLLFLIFGVATLSAGFVALLVASSVGAVALIMKLTGLGAIPSILIGFSASGILMAAVGTALVLYAKKKLSPNDLKPERTVRTLKNTTEWAKEKIHE